MGFILVDTFPARFYLEPMVISFTPEQEARLSEAAQADGVSPEHLVTEIVLGALFYEEDEAEEAVLVERRRQFEQGVFIPHDEMKRRIQQMMQR